VSKQTVQFVTVWLAWLVVPVLVGQAQPTVRLPSAAGSSGSPGGVYPPSAAAPAGTLGQTPGAIGSLGAPNFDPYSFNPGTVPPTLPPGSIPGTAGGTPLPAGVAPPPVAGGGYSSGGYGVQPGGPYGPAGPYGTLPPGAVPGGAPPALYPNGWNAPTWGGAVTQFLTPRLQYTWITGGNAPNDLSINDFDFSVAAAFPNFLYSSQPLYVVPSFSLHLWSGPQPPVGGLPGNAYSAFLDLGWATDPSQPVGGEIGVRTGVFSDFNTLNSDSLRIMGRGLMRIQAAPTTQFRAGVIYLDRNKLKLLPAVGILWTPNSQTRFDFYFPRPKLAQRLTTLGNHDLWWYVGGEYGGGSWTVQDPTSGSERIDINDIRIYLGLEWGQPAFLQQGRRTGFVEFGWVTSRELVYVVTPRSASIGDGWMIRAGWNY